MEYKAQNDALTIFLSIHLRQYAHARSFTVLPLTLKFPRIRPNIQAFPFHSALRPKSFVPTVGSELHYTKSVPQTIFK
jgi:hypothetical protein